MFYVLIAIISLEGLWNLYLSYRNQKSSRKGIPANLSDVFSKEEFEKSQAYQSENYKLGQINRIWTLIITLSFFALNGFEILNSWVYSLNISPILTSLAFFCILGIGSYLINLPFSYFKVFVIEDDFGFNTSSKALFWVDQIKGAVLTMVLGAVVLSLLMLIYDQLGNLFWLVSWALLSSISIFITFFYSTLIVPIFNKQYPMQQGDLRDKIMSLSKKFDFELNQVYVIDGSKRSTKANAYFSGFGSKKRIVLYDTLIKDLTEDEIVAVLAHEIGHYKKKHVLVNMLVSILLTGVMLYVFSWALQSDLLAQSLGIEHINFHIGLVVFSLLYQPISEITGVAINYISRKFEFQADNFAKQLSSAQDLISALKKLSAKSLSNLNPDELYEFVYYSHPNLSKRIKSLES